jgi:hypothetical protein
MAAVWVLPTFISAISETRECRHQADKRFSTKDRSSTIADIGLRGKRILV